MSKKHKNRNKPLDLEIRDGKVTMSVDTFNQLLDKALNHKTEVKNTVYVSTKDDKKADPYDYHFGSHMDW